MRATRKLGDEFLIVGPDTDVAPVDVVPRLGHVEEGGEGVDGNDGDVDWDSGVLPKKSRTSKQQGHRGPSAGVASVEAIMDNTSEAIFGENIGDLLGDVAEFLDPPCDEAEAVSDTLDEFPKGLEDDASTCSDFGDEGLD